MTFADWYQANQPRYGRPVAKDMAQGAWDYQQQRIAELEADLAVANELLDYYRNGGKPPQGYIEVIEQGSET